MRYNQIEMSVSEILNIGSAAAGVTSVYLLPHTPMEVATFLGTYVPHQIMQLQYCEKSPKIDANSKG